MTTRYEIPPDLVSNAEDYWEETGIPLSRDPKPEDKTITLGWSLGQDKLALFAWEVGADEDYGESAASAYFEIQDGLPDSFTSNGEEVFNVSIGFMDNYGDWFDEVSFDCPWYVTLLQYWLDQTNRNVCIVIPEGMKDDARISSHARNAKYTIETSGRQGAYKHFGVRNKIASYVASYYQKNKKLPYGTHAVDGINVLFPCDE